MTRPAWHKGDRVRCYARPWLGAGTVVDDEGRCVVVCWPEAYSAGVEPVPDLVGEQPRSAVLRGVDPCHVLHGVHTRSELRPETYRPRRPPQKPPQPTLYWYGPGSERTSTATRRGEGDGG